GIAYHGDAGALALAARDRAVPRFVASRFAQRGVALPALVGEDETCRAVANAWHARMHAAATLRFRFNEDVLRDSPRTLAAPGRPRPATVAETELVIEWLLAFR